MKSAAFINNKRIELQKRRRGFRAVPLKVRRFHHGAPKHRVKKPTPFPETRPNRYFFPCMRESEKTPYIERKIHSLSGPVPGTKKSFVYKPKSPDSGFFRQPSHMVNSGCLDGNARRSNTFDRQADDYSYGLVVESHHTSFEIYKIILSWETRLSSVFCKFFNNFLFESLV